MARTNLNDLEAELTPEEMEALAGGFGLIRSYSGAAPTIQLKSGASFTGACTVDVPCNPVTNDCGGLGAGLTNPVLDPYMGRRGIQCDLH